MRISGLLFIILFSALPCWASDSYRITLPNGFKIDAEVAKDKQRGLQGRKSLCQQCGMFFIFDREWYYPFWMKDTLINLSMLWIDSDGEIVHVVENAEPCIGKKNPYAECKVYSPSRTAKYVLEVNPKAASGIEIGTKIMSDPPLF